MGTTAAGYNSPAFPLTIPHDSNAPAVAVETPLRYGKLPEIHHIFRSDPKSPPLIISSFFLLAVLGTIPMLLGAVRLIPFYLYLCLLTSSPYVPLCLPRTDSVNWTVALPRRQHLIPPSRPVDLAGLARGLSRIHRRHRGCLLPILHQLESIPDAACAGRVGHRGVLERFARAHRGAGEEVERREVREAKTRHKGGKKSRGVGRRRRS